MTAYSAIRRAGESAAECSGICRITLFGSYARGDQSEDFDVDLMIETEDGFSLLDAARSRRLVSEALGKDVDVVSSRAAGGELAENARKDEVLVYDVA